VADMASSKEVDKGHGIEEDKGKRTARGRTEGEGMLRAKMRTRGIAMVRARAWVRPRIKGLARQTSR